MAHSEQQYSANLVATVVPVVFEGFAFAAENLPAMKFLSCYAARLFCEKLHPCVIMCWGKEEVKSKCASKRACRNNKVIVGNEAWAASLECTRIDVYRSLTPYLAVFCTTHRELFCMHPAVCLRFSIVCMVCLMFSCLLRESILATGQYFVDSWTHVRPIHKLCQRMPCWLQVKHDSFKASRKKRLCYKAIGHNRASLFTRQHGFRGVKLLSVTTNKLTIIYKVATNCKLLYS